MRGKPIAAALAVARAPQQAGDDSNVPTEIRERLSPANSQFPIEGAV